ncbi:hypothetical protein Ancab_001779, partial [Ancistrocladus abbreviatus]
KFVGKTVSLVWKRLPQFANKEDIGKTLTLFPISMEKFGKALFAHASGVIIACFTDFGSYLLRALKLKSASEEVEDFLECRRDEILAMSDVEIGHTRSP